MLGSKIQVTSRRFDAAADDTKVLSFDQGVHSRPLLRPGEHSERLYEGGTKIKIWLEQDPEAPGGFLAGNFNYLPKLPLPELCAWLCPSLPVDLQVRTESEQFKTIVHANDWLTIDSESLLKRVLRPIPEREAARLAIVIERNKKNVRNLVTEDGNILGRGCILLQDRNEIDNKSDKGPITVGGCRASGMHNFGGVIVGNSLRAARDSAQPSIDGQSVRDWATEQARLMTEISTDPELLNVGAGYIRSFGGSIGGLPIALSNRGWMDSKQIESYAKSHDEIILVSDTSYHFASQNRKIKLADGVLICNSGHWQSDWPTATPWHWHGSAFHFWTLLGATVEAIATAWSIALDAVLEVSDLTTDDKVYRRKIAMTSDGKPVVSSVDIVTRPSVRSLNPSIS